MNRWYNSRGTGMVDLDSINAYFYTPMEGLVHERDVKYNQLEVIIAGHPHIFRGPDAKELYDILVNRDVVVEKKKELIKG